MIKVYYNNNYYNNIKEKICENLFSNIKNNDFFANLRFLISLFFLHLLLTDLFKILSIIL